MTAPLRDYQAAALTAVRQAYRDGGRSICLVAPCGAGKTRMGVELATGHLRKGGRRVLWLAHRTELVKQAADRLRLEGVERVGIIAAGFEADADAPVQVASTQTLLARGAIADASLLILDECFPAGTTVLMADGSERPIESVGPGDEVHCGGRVAVASLQERMVVVRIVGSGVSLECTADHPIYVKGKGYVRAKEVVAGDLLCVWQGLRAPRREQAEDLLEGVLERSPVSNPSTATDDLDLQGVRKRDPEDTAQVTEDQLLQAVSLANSLDDDGQYQHAPRERAHEGAEPDAQTGNTSSRQRDVEGNRSRAVESRREWARTNAARGDVAGAVDQRWGNCPRRDQDEGNQGLRCSESLQGGFGPSSSEACDRGGRSLTHVVSASSAGREEDLVAHWTRVDRVEISERSGGDGTGSGDAGVPVYNLQTERGCYVAGRVLVHNCHHYVSEQWGDLAKQYAAIPRLGLTATPERGDGKPLGDLFDRLVVAATAADLTARGFLVPCSIEAPKRYTPTKLCEDPVEAYQRCAPNGLALAFTRTVKGANQMRDAFEAAGVRAGVVTATTKAADRAETIERFAAGEIRVLVNVGVLTEGTDIPAADTCILARGIGSAGLYIQIVGRILRPAPGKTKAMLLDLVGASRRHGPPAAEREFSLQGKAITWRKPTRWKRPEEPERANKSGVSSALLASVSPQRAEAMRTAMARYAAQALERGYKRGWAAYRFQSEFGVLPWQAPGATGRETA